MSSAGFQQKVIRASVCVDVVLLRGGVLLPVEIFDAIKRPLSGVYGNLSVPVIRIIGNDAIVGLFFDIYHKPTTPIPESIGIMRVLQDNTELIKQRHQH